MPPGEVRIDIALVRRLLAAQFPEWEDLPLAPVESAGTDNAIYRLGDAMAVRLPRLPDVVGQVVKEQHWLPVLASHLPLAIPVPLGIGTPAKDYPWPWSVYRWLDGENATIERLADHGEAARALAGFLAALQRIDPAGGPPSGAHNGFRGAPLAVRDPPTRAAIAALCDELDASAATAAWETALCTPAWRGAPVWLHGDLHSGNLLATEGRLSAVIDFGLLAVGDPACDLMVGWTLLSADTRPIFRAAIPVDEATWARGRGWALSFGLIALAYYLNTNPVLAAISRHAIDEALADHARCR
jgi:aminoglycoside phosphotransferase (APT) family kinase protein